ncbi:MULTISPECIES: hypothetical protein [Clostridium]|uniref:hypothetical protein n=1 Tax=Clostridium TaxID=1485 RepID=UPI0013EE642F|nr:MULTISPECIES: hypothetical protein [Clostridium]MBY6838711.1 hypothetical protein [Clostridium botulinum]MBZ9693296.1 hypothetical protein [Clostridium sp. M14]
MTREQEIKDSKDKLNEVIKNALTLKCHNNKCDLEVSNLKFKECLSLVNKTCKKCGKNFMTPLDFISYLAIAFIILVVFEKRGSILK